MSGYAFVLPWPFRELSPNARVHRMHKAELATYARGLGLLSARNVLVDAGQPQIAGSLEMRIVFHPPDGKRRDLDNLLASLKPYLDGIFQALGADDSLISRLVLDRGGTAPGGQVDVWVRDYTPGATLRCRSPASSAGTASASTYLTATFMTRHGSGSI